VTAETVDPQQARAFAGQVIGILNGASLAYMLSIGHRTGLFDSMATMQPSSSDEIAAATRLNERYVREWLGALVCGGVIRHDPVAGTYWLPAEHASSLTRSAGPGNLASITQYFALMGNVEDGVVRSFEKGGGVPYSEYPKFQELMREESAAVFDATLTDVTLPLVPGLVERLKSGIDVLDVGCGAGHAINLMARAYPNSRFTGFDFSEEGVSRGRTEADSWGLSNSRFEVKDVATLEGSPQFDFITAFDTIHDQAQPRRVLRGIYDALRPGGAFLCVDVAAASDHAGNMEHPLGPMLYTISTMHCMTVSLALGGEGLGTCWGEQKALELLAEAGFTNVAVKRVEGDIMNSYYIAMK